MKKYIFVLLFFSVSLAKDVYQFPNLTISFLDREGAPLDLKTRDGKNLLTELFVKLGYSDRSKGKKKLCKDVDSPLLFRRCPKWYHFYQSHKGVEFNQPITFSGHKFKDKRGYKGPSLMLTMSIWNPICTNLDPGAEIGGKNDSWQRHGLRGQYGRYRIERELFKTLFARGLGETCQFVELIGSKKIDSLNGIIVCQSSRTNSELKQLRILKSRFKSHKATFSASLALVIG